MSDPLLHPASWRAYLGWLSPLTDPYLGVHGGQIQFCYVACKETHLREDSPL